MEENKNNNSSVSGFDSVNRGYTVTPEGGFFEEREPEKQDVIYMPPSEENTEKEEPILEEAKEELHKTQSAPVTYAAPPPPLPPYKRPKKSKRNYGIGTVLVAAVLAALIGAASSIGAIIFLEREEQSAPSAEENNIVNTTINVDKVAASVIEAVAEKASPSVVGIRTTTAVTNFFGGVTDVPGEGSGVIYSSDGYIITNHHVIESVIGQVASKAKIEVFLNDNTGEAYPATLVGYNINSDLAVIKVDKSGLNAIEIADSDKLKVGQFVAAIGCPGGLDFMGSVSYGIVSGLDRTINSDDDAVSLIQTDAAINPGNSGGALLNTEGELIGINSSKIAATEYEGMGFSIPSNTVVEICDQIIAKKDDPEPYIGITISETYDERTLNRLGYPSGAVVSSVVSGGPAHESGINRGDIITEFAGKEISSFTELYEVINECSAGETVSVKIYRSGRYYSTEIEIGANNAR